MAGRDRRVDAYIGKAAPFARPILEHLRELVHTGCPNAEETIKWGMPFFVHQGILCHMAAFQRHCAFGFWRGSVVLADREAAAKPAKEAMGQFGRITSLDDLPADKSIIASIRKAAALNEAGVKRPAPTRKRIQRPVIVPADLRAALRANKKALQAFESFSPSHRREYVEWITEAKREETRQRRIDKAIAQITEGKPRNWKYQ
ncbi:MAG TPA: YdeI/OmpD-associated family protein [Planctomycetota bacterium]|nr:YdeI/OmpD-associated family protein [Planctomycetota bacterium]